MTKELIIVDGHAVLHRAYYALPDLTSSSGRLTNAVYGFFKTFFKIRREYDPEYFMVAFDTGKPNFRHQMFVGYQAKRPKTDKELVYQVEKTKEIVADSGIFSLEKDGFEADDVIGTAVDQVDLPVAIVTGDKDLMQLVNERISLLVPRRGFSGEKRYGSEEVVEELGVRPDQVVDYKALAGDASDNYPGIRGIGPKTAVKLLRRFGDIDNIYDNLAEIGGALQARLERGRENAYLSRRLAQIRRDVPIEIDKEQLTLDNLQLNSLQETFRDLGFRSLIKELNETEGEKNQIDLFS